MTPRAVRILLTFGPVLVGAGLAAVTFGIAVQEELRILIGGMVTAIGVRLWSVDGWKDKTL